MVETAVRFTEGNTAAVVSEAKSPIQSRALNSVYLSLSLFFSSHEGSWSPQSGIEAMRPALGAQSLKHWTTREVPFSLFEKPGRLQSMGWQRVRHNLAIKHHQQISIFYCLAEIFVHSFTARKLAQRSSLISICSINV